MICAPTYIFAVDVNMVYIWSGQNRNAAGESCTDCCHIAAERCLNIAQTAYVGMYCCFAALNSQFCWIYCASHGTQSASFHHDQKNALCSVDLVSLNSIKSDKLCNMFGQTAVHTLFCMIYCISLCLCNHYTPKQLYLAHIFWRHGAGWHIVRWMQQTTVWKLKTKIKNVQL